MTASTGPITLAFAGAGDVSADNVAELLNDWLGFGTEKDEDGFYPPSDREVNLIFPITKDHLNPQIKKVLDWSEAVDLPYTAVSEKVTGSVGKAVAEHLKNADDVVQGADVTNVVVRMLKDAAESYLVLLWGAEGEEPTEAAERLLDAATEAGVQAKDLTAGLDDISFADSAPEPEPEAEPEPPRRRGRKKAEPEAEAEPEEETPAPAKRTTRKRATAEEKRAAMEAEADTRDAAKEEIGLPHDRQTDSVLDHPSADLNVLAALRPLLAGALDAIDNRLTQNGHQNGHQNGQENGSKAPAKRSRAKKAAAEPEAVDDVQEAPKRGRGRPRRDGTPAQPRTPEELKVAVIKNPDGTYRRRGRGRTERTAEIIMVSPEELADLDLVDA